MTRRRSLIAGAVVLAAAGLALGLTLALSGGGSGGGAKAASSTATTGAAAGAGMERLFEGAQPGEKQTEILARWPKHPYQHYRDNLGDECFEWQGHDLYNLCFKGGVLQSKELF